MKQSTCFREFARYSTFNVLGMLGLSCYILADTFFVSQGLGINGLTALNLAIPIYSFIHGSGLMIGMGGGTRYSIRKYQKNRRVTDAIFTNSLYMAGVFALLFVLAGLFLPGRLAGLLGADQAVFAMTETYLRVILLFGPAFLLNNILLCFVRNDGAPQRSMAAMLGGSFSNVILDYLFIFPCNMGIFGAAFATGLAPIISMLILAPHFLRGKNGFRPVACRWDGAAITGVLSSGVPSLIIEASSGVVMIVFNTVILSLQGNTGVAAYGVIANLSLVMTAIYTGIAQGVQPLLSGRFGAGELGDVRRILGYALTAMLLLSALLYGGMFLGAEQIAALFNSEHSAELQRMAVQGLRLYFLACPFVGFNVILPVYFTSTDYARPAQVITLLRGFFVVIPATLLLAKAAGMTGVWCAFPATEFLVAGVGLVAWLNKYRKK